MDKPKDIKNFTEQEIESAVKWASDPENMRYTHCKATRFTWSS